MELDTRLLPLNTKSKSVGPVVYWMSRDQRMHDNWALLYAQQQAIAIGQPLLVVFNLVGSFLHAADRHVGFMLQGLQELEQSLIAYNIPFAIVQGEPGDTIPRFVKKHKAGLLVTDLSPLRISKVWKNQVAQKIPVAMIGVDAHNIVSVWEASTKQEFAARILRPKLHLLLPQYLVPFPKLKRHPISSTHTPVQWKQWRRLLVPDPSLSWIQSGQQAAQKAVRQFLHAHIHSYDTDRNNPNLPHTQSNLSPYLHFGHISSASIALAVQELPQSASTKAFLEELIVRKELAENFCWYNPHYDSVEGFPAWAQKSLREHARDKRQYHYNTNVLEHGKTHDDLWNAAQLQMVYTGKMHGYMRMYWAKKILEWTKDAAEALRIANLLNDKYELDGRDPNGYTGTAWSIGGVHDRPWFTHPIFGQIRYMSYGGAKSKFNITTYINSVYKNAHS